jgi:hypothetical protein
MLVSVRSHGVKSVDTKLTRGKTNHRACHASRVSSIRHYEMLLLTLDMSRQQEMSACRLYEDNVFVKQDICAKIM